MNSDLLKNHFSKDTFSKLKNKEIRLGVSRYFSSKRLFL